MVNGGPREFPKGGLQFFSKGVHRVLKGPSKGSIQHGTSKAFPQIFILFTKRTSVLSIKVPFKYPYLCQFGTMNYNYRKVKVCRVPMYLYNSCPNTLIPGLLKPPYPVYPRHLGFSHCLNRHWLIPYFCNRISRQTRKVWKITVFKRAETFHVHRDGQIWGTFGYFEVLLDTFGYFWVLLETFGYFEILLGNFWDHF